MHVCPVSARSGRPVARKHKPQTPSPRSFAHDQSGRPIQPRPVGSSQYKYNHVTSSLLSDPNIRGHTDVAQKTCELLLLEASVLHLGVSITIIKNVHSSRFDQWLQYSPSIVFPEPNRIQTCRRHVLCPRLQSSSVIGT
jgi:hypothetical protein